MEMHTKQYGKQYMKMVMLKQEEIFSHQVHELHRLYRVQRVLMKDIESKMKMLQSANTQLNFATPNAENGVGSYQSCQESFCQRSRRQALDPKLISDACITKDDQKIDLEVDEESYLELTLAIGSNSMQRKKNDISFASDSASNFSSTESRITKTKNSKRVAFKVQDVSLMTSPDDWRNELRIEERLRHDRLKHHSFLQCQVLKCHSRLH